MSDPPAKVGWEAYKGPDQYADTFPGVKTALTDVVIDINKMFADYIAPLATKEAACRGGLRAQQ